MISGFVDPEFGANPGSLRLLASVLITFVVQNVLGWWIIAQLVEREDSTLKPVLTFRYGSLLIVLASVVLSRLVGFEPGMVFGLIVGLTFGASLARARSARITLIGAGYPFVLALIGWIGYSVMHAVVGADPGVAGRFAMETLSGLAVSGIAALPIALLPLAVLDGGALFAWKRWVWAIAYGVGLFAFLLILMPLPFSWGTVGAPFATWISLYLAYALVAVGVWAWFRFAKAQASAQVSAQAPEAVSLPAEPDQL